jgi:co-chaperonin GroES (HSP10)
MSGSGIEMVTEPTSKYSVVSKLLGKMVLCHWIKPELKTQTGIILNENAVSNSETFWKGKVLKVGEDCTKVKVGDTIFMSYMLGSQDWREGKQDDNMEFRLTKEENIYGIY